MIDLQQTRAEVKRRSEGVLDFKFDAVKPRRKNTVEVDDVCGDWTVISKPYQAFNGQGKSCKYVDCRCVCGNEVPVLHNSISRKRTSRCRDCNNARQRKSHDR